MGDLARDLDAKLSSKVRPGVEDVIALLDDDDRDAFMRALTDRAADNNFRWSASQLGRRMAEEGHDLTVDQIKRWRILNGA